MPTCQFCGCEIGEGFRHGTLYVCVDCWDLIQALIEDYEVGLRERNPVERLEAYEWKGDEVN